jgi:hypothetical protein
MKLRGYYPPLVRFFIGRDEGVPRTLLSPRHHAGSIGVSLNETHSCDGRYHVQTINTVPLRYELLARIITDESPDWWKRAEKVLKTLSMNRGRVG